MDAGVSLVSPSLPAFAEAAVLLSAAFKMPLLAARLWEAVPAAREDLEDVRVRVSGKPVLKLFLTSLDTFLTMVVSTRRREKSVAFTTVMPLLLLMLLLLMMMLVLLMTVLLGLVPYPQGLGAHPI